MPTILERFQGPENRRRLIDVLKRQVIVQGDEEVASMLADSVQLEEIEAEREFIAQGAGDADMYFILSGSVNIMVNQREVAVRRVNQHVGEMVLIDSTATRSASVVAAEPTVVAKIGEAKFSEIATAHPDLWRQLAVQLCERLRARNDQIRVPNAEPRIFIGSSKEGLTVAQNIQLGLNHEPFVVKLWTNEVFTASNFVLDELLDEVREADFAILVISPDDKYLTRGEEVDAPRDNVIFELGLFMGGLGRQRTLLVRPRGVDIKFPTDLFGLIDIDYKVGPASDIVTNISPVCTKIKTFVEGRGVK